MTLYSGLGISLFMSEPLLQMKQPRYWEGGDLLQVLQAGCGRAGEEAGCPLQGSPLNHSVTK